MVEFRLLHTVVVGFSVFCYFNISLNLYRVPSYLFVVPNWWRRGFETTYSRKSKEKSPVDSHIN